MPIIWNLMHSVRDHERKFINRKNNIYCPRNEKIPWFCIKYSFFNVMPLQLVTLCINITTYVFIDTLYDILKLCSLKTTALPRSMHYVMPVNLNITPSPDRSGPGSRACECTAAWPRFCICTCCLHHGTSLESERTPSGRHYVHLLRFWQRESL